MLNLLIVQGKLELLKLGFRKALFLGLCYSYYILMKFLLYYRTMPLPLYVDDTVILCSGSSWNVVRVKLTN